jgi:hypothetical protein
VKLTTHLQLEPRSRKPGSTHPLPYTPSRGSAYLKYREQLFLYTNLVTCTKLRDACRPTPLLCWFFEEEREPASFSVVNGEATLRFAESYATRRYNTAMTQCTTCNGLDWLLIPGASPSYKFQRITQLQPRYHPFLLECSRLRSVPNSFNFAKCSTMLRSSLHNVYLVS